jgi:hypothetical protein
MKGQLSIIGLSNELEIKSKKRSVVSMDCLNAIDCRIGPATSGGLSKK